MDALRHLMNGSKEVMGEKIDFTASPNVDIFKYSLALMFNMQMEEPT